MAIHATQNDASWQHVWLLETSPSCTTLWQSFTSQWLSPFGLLQDMHCISLSIIEVAFETSPAVLITFFQLRALQCMLHDPWNVVDLQGATQTSISRQKFHGRVASNVLGLHKLSSSCTYECSV